MGLRRKRLPPDNRPKWDDPDLPVHVKGFVLPPEKFKALCEVNFKYNPAPNWRNDPSYNWAAKPRQP